MEAKMNRSSLEDTIWQSLKSDITIHGIITFVWNFVFIIQVAVFATVCSLSFVLWAQVQFHCEKNTNYVWTMYVGESISFTLFCNRNSLFWFSCFVCPSCYTNTHTNIDTLSISLFGQCFECKCMHSLWWWLFIAKHDIAGLQVQHHCDRHHVLDNFKHSCD